MGPEVVIEQVENGRCDLGIGTFSGEDPDVESQTALRDQLMIFGVAPSRFRRTRVGRLVGNGQSTNHHADSDKQY